MRQTVSKRLAPCPARGWDLARQMLNTFNHQRPTTTNVDHGQHSSPPWLRLNRGRVDAHPAAGRPAAAAAVLAHDHALPPPLGRAVAAGTGADAIALERGRAINRIGERRCDGGDDETDDGGAEPHDDRAFKLRTARAVHLPLPRAVCTPRRFSSAAAALALRPASSPSMSGRINPPVSAGMLGVRAKAG